MNTMRTAPTTGPAMPVLPAASAPLQLLCSRFDAPPDTVWQRLVAGPFIAEYLGARLPRHDAPLRSGQALQGADAQGRALRLTVTEASAPCSLSLRLEGADGAQALRLCIEPCAQGSRLTVLHEPVEGPDHDEAGGDAIARLLRAPLPAVLAADRIASAEGLQRARAYLADSAAAVAQLLAAMAPRQGYRKPAADRFSLVEQLWHLADVEEFGWARRWPRVLQEERPRLPGVDGDRLARERRYQQRPWRAAARRFIAQRRRSLAALARLDAAMLERRLLFSGRAADAGTLLAAMLAHDHEHRLEMAALWTAERGRDEP
ncbi:DinB family protein [Aquabacterium sp.]|uniref:DinB family protein n=1 Tax=Aquabacterium sp. TaxID=1872578 RepID=UPI003784FD64